tara:strand:+ start:760 stop:1053 length:294 start_codon:yes stop_codon:yes gene_type:complete
MYRPLPPYLTIKESSIEGLGLFAREDIPADTNLGISHYFSKMLGKTVRTPLGGFYNYSEDANCYSLISTEFAELITQRNIKAGEEITTTYKIQPLHP